MTSPPGQHLLVRSISPTSGAPVDVGSINVLVGGNRVGKSEALRDLARLTGNIDPSGAARDEHDNLRTTVIQDVTFVSKLSIERLVQGLATASDFKGDGGVVQGLGPDLHSPYRRTLSGELKGILFRPIITARSVATTALGEIMPLRVAFVSAERRAELVKSSVAVNPLFAPENLLQAFQFASPDLHQQLEDAISFIFDGLKVRLDSTQRVNLTLRVASEFPAATNDPIRDAQNYQQLPELDSAGDGLRNVVAVILTFLTCPGRIILLDEPALSLHSEQARRLGQWIAEHSVPLGTQVFLSSREPALIEGLFSGATDVTVLRMTRRDNITRFEAVPPEIGRTIARFPLFASQNALRCLMQDGVVITAEESGRIIYQTVAKRFTNAHDIGFLHSHGARNLASVARVMRRAHLPTCAIADLDVFQNETAYADLVKALSQNAPPQPWLATRERLVSQVEGWFDEEALSSSASEVESFLDQLKQGAAAGSNVQTPKMSSDGVQLRWERLRREKLGALPPELRVWVEELLEDMKHIGLFVSPKGRLQAWIDFGTDDEDDVWFNRAIQTLDREECPAELRAFMAAVTAFIGASTPPRMTRTGHGA